MRVGIVGLLHESNTFAGRPTNLADFAQQSLFIGEEIRQRLAETHHEVGGFFAGLNAAETGGCSEFEAVPLLFARALPSGLIHRNAWQELMDRLFAELDRSGPIDGILVAPHGATVSEEFPDADGYWLSELRNRIGRDVPIIGTLDAHANLSPQMVAACTALVAYRTNPHLDQRERGIEAAQLMVSTLRGEVRPVMRAEFPPMAISIDKQMTAEAPLRPLYELAERQRQDRRLLSNSIVLGFPYADVAEMGSSIIAVADGNAELAAGMARQLSNYLWEHRQEFLVEFLSVGQALEKAVHSPRPVCLLDMGDNVGGGSAADGTVLVHALHQQRLADSFACLFDPEAVAEAERVGPGRRCRLSVGGKSDQRHGSPFVADFTVISLHDGRFTELQPRHGGIADFDQGRTAIVETDYGLVLMLTSRRMVPFSLQQLISCGLDPSRYQILVAKGVNAPIAAYAAVCRSFVRVNTPGSTCADMRQLSYQHRRRPMFPFEAAAWSQEGEEERGAEGNDESVAGIPSALPSLARVSRGQSSSSPPAAFPDRGALLGIDFGTRRVGVALSTPDGSMASPLENYQRRNEKLDEKHFRELTADYRVVGIVVGLPVHVAGHESQKSREARAYGDWLAKVTGLPVTFWDERYTSAVAEEAMIAIDMTRRQRKARLDKAAAQLMLQAFLNARQVQRSSEQTEPGEA